MTLRLMSALCILILVGCTSSEPEKASYTPAIEGAATMPAPLQAPVSYDQAGQVAPSDIAAPVALQPGCSTVDNVTLCDAPADAAADDTSYTN